MKNKGLFIAMSCAIGAGLGTVFAINFGKYWAFGLALGAVAGLIPYGIKLFVEALARDFRRIRDEFKRLTWSRAKESAKEHVFMIVVLFAIVISFMIIPGCWLFVITPSFFGFSIDGWWTEPSKHFALDYVLLNGVATGLVLIDLTGLLWKSEKRTFDPCYSHAFAKRNDWTLFLGASISQILVFLGIVNLIIQGITLTIKGIKIFAAWISENSTEFFWSCVESGKAFFWKFLQYLHSDPKFLIGIGCIIGGAVGLYFKEMWVGMIVGGLCGFAEYRLVIFVLKFKPRVIHYNYRK